MKGRQILEGCLSLFLAVVKPEGLYWQQFNFLTGMKYKSIPTHYEHLLNSSLSTPKDRISHTQIWRSVPLRCLNTQRSQGENASSLIISKPNPIRQQEWATAMCTISNDGKQHLRWQAAPPTTQTLILWVETQKYFELHGSFLDPTTTDRARTSQPVVTTTLYYSLLLSTNTISSSRATLELSLLLVVAALLYHLRVRKNWVVKRAEMCNFSNPTFHSGSGSATRRIV